MKNIALVTQTIFAVGRAVRKLNSNLKVIMFILNHFFYIVDLSSSRMERSFPRTTPSRRESSWLYWRTTTCQRKYYWAASRYQPRGNPVRTIVWCNQKDYFGKIRSCVFDISFLKTIIIFLNYQIYCWTCCTKIINLVE